MFPLRAHFHWFCFVLTDPIKASSTFPSMTSDLNPPAVSQQPSIPEREWTSASGKPGRKSNLLNLIRSNESKQTSSFNHSSHTGDAVRTLEASGGIGVNLRDPVCHFRGSLFSELLRPNEGSFKGASPLPFIPVHNQRRLNKSGSAVAFGSFQHFIPRV